MYTNDKSALEELILILARLDILKDEYKDNRVKRGIELSATVIKDRMVDIFRAHIIKG